MNKITTPPEPDSADIILAKLAPDWHTHLLEPTTMAHVISSFMACKRNINKEKEKFARF